MFGFVGVVLGTACLAALDFLSGLLIQKRPAKAHTLKRGGLSSNHTVLVFPGFSNPAHLLGAGVAKVVGDDKTIVVVDYGTSMNDDDIYTAVMNALSIVGYSLQITIYGHSMGGQVGTRFLQRYEQEGSKLGYVRHFVLDCSPALRNSLKTPIPKALVRLLLRLLWAGPTLSSTIALGNILSRKAMPPRLDDTADRKLYKRYTRGMMLFNPKAWLAQLRYMFAYTNHDIKPPSAAVFYIHPTAYETDQLVDEIAAIQAWRCAYPDLVLVPSAHISHAWPMEQPQAYVGIFDRIWRQHNAV